MAASGKLIESAVGLAAPVLLALLLADLVLGLVGRLVPRIPVYAHGTPVRALLGLAALLVTLAGIDLAIAGRVGDFFGLLDRALGQGS
jgi:flagellar biosynthesis protein FliR/FlhB